MVGETFAGLTAIKTAFDLAKGLKDIDDATRRNAAIIDLQEKILTAQREQAEMAQRIGELEAEVARFQVWDAEKSRYGLKDFGGNTFAYELKQADAAGEPIHRACPSCFERQKRAILQFRGRNAYSQDMYKCSGCEQTFEFGPRTPPQQLRRRSWAESRGI